MAYQPENLSALSYANGFTLWHYRTADFIEEVTEGGYFDNAARMLRVGDFICINAGTGFLPVNTMLAVTVSNGLAVTVAALAHPGVQA